jgi:hypothetical protein
MAELDETQLHALTTFPEEGLPMPPDGEPLHEVAQALLDARLVQVIADPDGGTLQLTHRGRARRDAMGPKPGPVDPAKSLAVPTTDQGVQDEPESGDTVVDRDLEDDEPEGE